MCGGSGIPKECDCDGNVLDDWGFVVETTHRTDECGVLNGPGPVYECGCEDIPEEIATATAASSTLRLCVLP